MANKQKNTTKVRVVKAKGFIMSFKILVMSCDRYLPYTSDLFHHCIEKYWKNHPQVYYCTESVNNKYYPTIHSNHPVSEWTKRVYECLDQIDSDIVLVCPDDTFFRKQVNEQVLDKLCSYIDDKLIAINLEPPFDCYQDNGRGWSSLPLPPLLVLHVGVHRGHDGLSLQASLLHPPCSRSVVDATEWRQA